MSMVQWYYDWLTESSYHMHAVSQSLYVGKSAFQEIAILDLVEHGKLLVLDGDTQAVEKDEFIYHECLVQIAMCLHPQPRQVLILGGGDGCALREALRHPTVERAVMIDIDREVVAVSEKYLPEFSAGAFRDPRSVLVFEDARRWLEEHEERFDVIVSDLTEPIDGSPSSALFTEEFYRLVESRLNRPGIFSQQSSKGDFGLLEMHARICRTLRTAFRHVQSIPARIPSYDTTWAFAISSNEVNPEAVSASEVDAVVQARGLRLRFYDGTTHEGLVRLPKFLREARDQVGPTFTDASIGLPVSAARGSS